MVNSSKLIFKMRGLVMVPPLVFAGICTWGEVEDDGLIFGVGGAVFLLGLLLRIWSQMHLKYRLKRKTVLTLTGPYQVVRNPIYIANILLLVGVCVMTELFWFVPVMFAYALGVYTLVISYEEAHLHRKYAADYDAYCKAVPRWLPKFKLFHQGRAHIKKPLVKQSILAEAHNLLFLLPVVFKELFL